MGPCKFEYIWRAGHIYSNIYGPTSHIYPKIGDIRYYMIFVPYKIGNRPCKFENRHIRYYMAAKFEYRPIFEFSCARSPYQIPMNLIFGRHPSDVTNSTPLRVANVINAQCRGRVTPVKYLTLMASRRHNRVHWDVVVVLLQRRLGENLVPPVPTEQSRLHETHV